VNGYLPGFESEYRDHGKSQFFTPPDLAQRIVDWAMAPLADKPCANVLEPSCGHGALVRALDRYVANGACVFGVDIDPRNIARCRERWADALGITHEFFCCDFMGFPEASLPRFFYDISIQNTPFEDEQAATHIMHALTMADRVAAHVPLTTLEGQVRKTILWDRVNLHRLAICSRRWKYGADGGATAMCTVDVTLRKEGDAPVQTAIEWWV